MAEAPTPRWEVIHQRDLLTALTHPTGFRDERGIVDWPNDLTPLLDPDGKMLVSLRFLHNDGPDFRIFALAKLRDTNEPATVVFTLPGRFGRIVQTIHSTGNDR